MTIAQQLKITEFPFKINDSKGKWIYFETSTGYNRFWERRERDSNGNVIYYENSNGYWEKCEYDFNGKEIYYEDSNGEIKDNRPKTDIQKAIELLEKEGLLVDGKVIK
jgi:hypothetical protein